MAGLPERAVLAISRIEALLAEAQLLIERTGVADDTAFSLRETQRRYLPDTLDAYLKLPPSQRDTVADSLLVDQLQLLERATAQRLAALAQSGRADLAANGAFLVERFGPADRLPDVRADAAPVPAPASSRALVTRLFAEFERSDAGAGRTNPAALLELAGRRFAAVFPALTTIRRGPFGGPVKRVAIDVPRGADRLSYALEAERGGVAASCTKFVRGIALRTERVELGDWMRGLLADMTAYVEHDRAAHDLLAAFLAG